jgi:hypothetical protein
MGPPRLVLRRFDGWGTVDARARGRGANAVVMMRGINRRFFSWFKGDWVGAVGVMRPACSTNPSSFWTSRAASSALARSPRSLAPLARLAPTHLGAVALPRRHFRLQGSQARDAHRARHREGRQGQRVVVPLLVAVGPAEEGGRGRARRRRRRRRRRPPPPAREQRSRCPLIFLLPAPHAHRAGGARVGTASLFPSGVAMGLVVRVRLRGEEEGRERSFT